MIKWIKDIEWGKVLLVGGIYTIISIIIHQIEAGIMMPYYQSEVYRGVWSKLFMSTWDQAFEFYVHYGIGTFLTGVSLCIIYYYLKAYLPKKKWERTFFFADVLVACSFIFFTIPVYVLFNVPIALLLTWFVSGFVSILVASVLIVHTLSK